LIYLVLIFILRKLDVLNPEKVAKNKIFFSFFFKDPKDFKGLKAEIIVRGCCSWG
jgi:hypothetical protein